MIKDLSVQEEEANGSELEQGTESRLKYIQNISHISVEELDIFLELGFIQKHGYDIDKVASSLTNYRMIIKDAFDKNHKRGYIIWVNLKGYAFALVYILLKVHFPFQIDIFEKVEEIKSLLFNSFWAQEIQQSEEFLILKLCTILLIFRKKASSVQDVIFEFEKYQDFLIEVFERHVLLNKYDCSSLYLYKAFSAAAFAMQYRKYDIKLRYKVFGLGQQVFEYIWVHKVDENYIQDDKERLKCIHCYFEFTSKHLKLLHYDQQQKRILELLLSQCSLLLQTFSPLLQKDYLRKMQLRIKKSKNMLSQGIKSETLNEQYFQDSDKEQEEEIQEQKRDRILLQKKKKNKESPQKQQEVINSQNQLEKDLEKKEIDDGEAEADKEKILLENNEDDEKLEKKNQEKVCKSSIQNYVKQFMLNKFSQQPETVAIDSNTLQIPLKSTQKRPSESLGNITFLTGEFGKRIQSNMLIDNIIEARILKKASSNNYRTQLNKISRDDNQISFSNQNDLKVPNNKFNSTVQRIFDSQIVKNHDLSRAEFPQQFSFRNPKEEEVNQLYKSNSLKREVQNEQQPIKNLVFFRSNRSNRIVKSVSEHNSRSISFNKNSLHKMNESILCKTLSKAARQNIPDGVVQMQSPNGSTDNSVFIQNEVVNKPTKSLSTSVSCKNVQRASQVYRSAINSFSTSSSSQMNLLQTKSGTQPTPLKLNNTQSSCIFYIPNRSYLLQQYSRDGKKVSSLSLHQSKFQNHNQSNENELLKVNEAVNKTQAQEQLFEQINKIEGNIQIQKENLHEKNITNNLSHVPQVELKDEFQEQLESSSDSFLALPYPSDDFMDTQKKIDIETEINNEGFFKDRMEEIHQQQYEGISSQKLDQGTPSSTIKSPFHFQEDQRDSQVASDGDDSQSRLRFMNSLTNLKLPNSSLKVISLEKIAEEFQQDKSLDKQFILERKKMENFNFGQGSKMNLPSEIRFENKPYLNQHNKEMRMRNLSMQSLFNPDISQQNSDPLAISIPILEKEVKQESNIQQTSIIVQDSPSNQLIQKNPLWKRPNFIQPPLLNSIKQRSFQRPTLRHSTLQTQFSLPTNDYHHQNSLSPRKLLSFNKITAFQAFLIEEQQKQIDQSQNLNKQDSFKSNSIKPRNDSIGPSVSSSITRPKKDSSFDHTKNMLRQSSMGSGEAGQDQSMLLYQLQRKMTIGSSTSSHLQFTSGQLQGDGGKLRIPLSLVDYDFDQYTQIYKEGSPSISIQLEGGNLISNVQNSSFKTTHINPNLDEIQSNVLLEASIEEKNKPTLRNLDLETEENKSKFNLNLDDVLQFSDAVSLSMKQSNQKEQNNIKPITVESESSSSSSSIISAKNAETITVALARLQGLGQYQTQNQNQNKRKGEKPQARIGESMRRLSIQSKNMLSQQQISLVSLKDVFSRDKNLQGKPQLQNLLSHIELEKQKSEIMKEINESQKTQVSIKYILSNQKKLKDNEDEEKDTPTNNQEINNSNLSLSPLHEDSQILQNNFNENANNMHSPKSILKQKEFFSRQRSFFYKQKQEQIKQTKSNSSSPKNQISIPSKEEISKQSIPLEQNGSSSSSDESKMSISSTPKRLKQLITEINFHQINKQSATPNFIHEKSKKKKSSQFIMYKSPQKILQEVIENQPSVSKNNELHDVINSSSINERGEIKTPDFRKMDKKLKKSNFTEELGQSQFKERKKKRETSIIKDLDGKQGSSSRSSSPQNEEEEEPYENLKLSSLHNHQITFFPSSSQINQPDIFNSSTMIKNKSKKGPLKKKKAEKVINSTEEHIFLPFNPCFKFVRFIQGKPMVLTVSYNASCVSEKENQNIKNQDTIKIKFNDQQLFFAHKEGTGQLISEMKISLDFSIKIKQNEQIKQNQKKREKLIQAFSQQNYNQERLIPEEGECDIMTFWPLFNVGLEKYLREILPKVYTIPDPQSEEDIEKISSNKIEENQGIQKNQNPSQSKFGNQQQLLSPKKIQNKLNIDLANNNNKNNQNKKGKSKRVKEIISQYNLFIDKPANVQELVSEYDLRNIGRIKDKINQLVKHYGKQVRKDMGISFFISNEDQTNQLVLVSLRKSIDKSRRAYSNIVPFYTWHISLIRPMKQFLYEETFKNQDKEIQIPTSCLKEPNFRKTENYYLMKHIKYLYSRLLKIIQSPPIIFSFLKKDEAQKYHFITVKISFKPGSENIKSSDFSNFSFYILGKNMRTLMNTIQPLDIHVDEIIENDPSLVYVYKIMSRYPIYDRIPRKWTELLIQYFNRILVFRSTDKFLRQNYEYKLESIFSIRKKEQQYGNSIMRQDKSIKYSQVNNIILRNIIYKETLKKEEFQTMFDEKYRESYIQFQSQMRFNISDLEELLADDNQDLKEAEIDFIRRMCKDNEQAKSLGPRVANLTQQDKIDKGAEPIIFNNKILDEKRRLLEMIIRKSVEHFKRASKKDIFCNRKSLSVLIWKSSDYFRSFWVTLSMQGGDLILNLTSIHRNEKYKFIVRKLKQKELILNLFKIKQSNPTSCFQSPPQKFYPLIKQVQLRNQLSRQFTTSFLVKNSDKDKEKENKEKDKKENEEVKPVQPSIVGYKIINSQFLRSFLIKNILKMEITFQGQRILPQKLREHELRNHFNIESLNTIKDHLLLSQGELLRYYSKKEFFFVRNSKSLKKTSIIIKAFKLGSEQQTALDGQQCLFFISLIPYQSRTRHYTFLLNYSDLLKLCPQLAVSLMANFDFKQISNLVEFIVNQFSTLRSELGRMPIFSFVEKEQVIGLERQVYYQMNKKEPHELIKAQKNFSQISAKNIFKKIYSSARAQAGTFNNRKKLEQQRQNTLKIRFLRNRFYKNEYEFSKHSKSTAFLEDYSFKHRIIIQQPKLFGQYWGLLTVSKDVMGSKWNIRIYIPKTSRTISCKLSYSDFESCSSEFISHSITKKLIFFFENPLFPTFDSFQQFHDRSLHSPSNNILNFLSKKNKMKNIKTKNSSNDFKLPLKSALFKKIVKKHWAELMADSFVDFQKLSSVKKIYRINKFLDITKEMDDGFSMHIQDNRQNFILRFIEIETWLRMISVCHFRINHSNLEMYLHFGSAKLMISELVLHDQYKISESNEFDTEIYIDLIKNYYNPSKVKVLKTYLIISLTIKHFPIFGLNTLINEYFKNKDTFQQLYFIQQESEERKEFANTKKALIDHYFNTMEYLPYESTSKFKFQLINFSIQTQTTKVFTINLREILNLYIAEGFSKLHTGYTNSKVTYKDLKEVCAFIIFKIKTQNFLDLALNENAGPKVKQISIEKNNLQSETYPQLNVSQSSMQSFDSGPSTPTFINMPSSQQIKINEMNSSISNQNKPHNIFRNDKKSIFAQRALPEDENSKLTPFQMAQSKLKQMAIRSQQPQNDLKIINTFEDISKKVMIGQKLSESNQSQFSSPSHHSSCVILSPAHSKDQPENLTLQNGYSNSTDLEESSQDPSDASQVYIFDSIVDVKNRIMIRAYFYISDTTFVVKLSQCGTGLTFTRFLHLNYFLKKDLLFNQYLKVELYDEIIRRATRAIKRKMYTYFCIQHKIVPNSNLNI